LALVVAAIFVGFRLSQHRLEAPQAPAAALEQPVAPLAQSQEKQLSRELPAKAPQLSAMPEEQNSTAATAVAASIHPEALHEEETNVVAKLPAGSQARGEVAQQVLPDILDSARKSIRGTVRVRVKVDVDHSGNVEGAELESRGPSKYFAREALQAAQLWRFRPASVSGKGVLSSWILQFEFTRDGTTVVPTQEIP